MTVSEVLKNVDKSLVHFAIFESINSNKSMYENIDTITKRGRIVHPKFPYTLEELENREVCDIFPLEARKKRRRIEGICHTGKERAGRGDEE